jgi:hypothetical protein
MANFSLSIIQILEPRPQAEYDRILKILIYDSASCIFSTSPKSFFWPKNLCWPKKRMAESYKFFMCNLATGRNIFVKSPFSFKLTTVYLSRVWKSTWHKAVWDEFVDDAHQNHPFRTAYGCLECLQP